MSNFMRQFLGLPEQTLSEVREQCRKLMAVETMASLRHDWQDQIQDLDVCERTGLCGENETWTQAMARLVGQGAPMCDLDTLTTAFRKDT